MCECECTRARRGRRVNQPPQDVFFFRFFFTLRVHFSKSGRLERLLPVAEEHAFVLKSMGLLHAPKR